MGSLNGSYQVESLPNINVPVERPGVCGVIFGRCNTQDGLQVARLPENPPLWSESVTTHGPELQKERAGTSQTYDTEER